MKITEHSSLYENLENMTTSDLLQNMNREDQKVADVIGGIIPDVGQLIEAVYANMKKGGRLFYIGAGTSGRLGILDASECPPTFGVPHGLVIGLIAGGDDAIRKAVENAEDDLNGAWHDLNDYKVGPNDFVIGIAASGTTPYVVGGLKKCKEAGIKTGCITCNPDAPVAEVADFPIIAVVGPEFVTGSTRMKAGTAQKLILNMISTSVMIKLGKVKGNKMVDMQLSNQKLVERGTRMISEATNLPTEKARELLLKHGSVRSAIDHFREQA